MVEEIDLITELVSTELNEGELSNKVLYKEKKFSKKHFFQSFFLMTGNRIKIYSFKNGDEIDSLLNCDFYDYFKDLNGILNTLKLKTSIQIVFLLNKDSSLTVLIKNKDKVFGEKLILKINEILKEEKLNYIHLF